MKKIVIASILVGAAVAGLLFYLRNQLAEKKTSDDVEDAADNAYNTMNKHIGRVERTFDHALN
jgi:hypothetical protein